MATVIETKELTKEYAAPLGTKAYLALENLNLKVEQGEIFGFLGPNGAGKTTTIKILLGIIFPTSGTARVLDMPVGSRAAKKKIGYLPEGSYYHEFLRGEEVLSFYGHLYGLRGTDLDTKIDQALETVGLSHARKMQVKTYSKGMRQRIGLAQALLSDPEVLIMDEPTQGLDPIARREIRDILLRLRDEGKTLFVCSHELSEVEMICDRVIILNQGRVVEFGRLQDLIFSESKFELSARGLPEDFEGSLKSKSEDYEIIDRRGNEWLITIPMTKEAREEVVALVESKGGELISLRPSKDSLEDLFLKSVKGDTAAS